MIYPNRSTNRPGFEFFYVRGKGEQLEEFRNSNIRVTHHNLCHTKATLTLVLSVLSYCFVSFDTLLKLLSFLGIPSFMGSKGSR